MLQKSNTKSQQIIKEWVQLTLCDMVKEVVSAVNLKMSSKEIVEIIDEYSDEIFEAQFIAQKEYDRDKKA